MKTVMETILGEEGYAEWTKSVTAKKLLYDVMRDPSTQLTVLHEPERKRMKRTVQRK